MDSIHCYWHISWTISDDLSVKTKIGFTKSFFKENEKNVFFLFIAKSRQNMALCLNWIIWIEWTTNSHKYRHKHFVLLYTYMYRVLYFGGYPLNTRNLLVWGRFAWIRDLRGETWDRRRWPFAGVHSAATRWFFDRRWHTRSLYI